MKICIVTYDEYLNIPYIKKYEQELLSLNISYDILLWNRTVETPELPNRYIFRCNTSRYKILKILPFIKWRRFCINILSEKKYDKIIILTTIPGVLISNYILKKYKNKYLFDIRDYTYEKLKFYKNIVGNIIRNSYCTMISSSEFLSWLDESDRIYITHNITNANKEYEYNTSLKKENINFAFVGGLRYYNENIKIIRSLANKSFITLYYIGKRHPGTDLEEYCQKNNIKNVVFKGHYENTEKINIYKNIDLINAIYGNSTLEVLTALPNKLYDCVLFKKPIVVSPNTYLSKVVKKYNLGFSIDLNTESLEQKIKNYIDNFDENLFLNGCKNFLENIMIEEKKSIEKIRDFLK